MYIENLYGLATSLATEELDDIWISSTMSHSQAFAAKYEGNIQDEQIDLKQAVPQNYTNISMFSLTIKPLNSLNQSLGITKSNSKKAFNLDRSNFTQ